MKRKLGSGAYGSVYRETDSDGREVAVKRCYWEDAGSLPQGFSVHTVPPNLLKELSVLTQLNHPNVVRLLDASVAHDSVCMVFELMEQDLAAYLRVRRLPEKSAWALAGQLFAGLNHMHLAGVVHRDLKPANVLMSGVHTDHPCLKIADLGLARTIGEPVQIYSPEMITLWYRPPELLLGAEVYGPEIDIWSAGCIVSEMILRQPLMPGGDEIDQLDRIVQLLGKPNEEQWPEMNSYPESDEMWAQIKTTASTKSKTLGRRLAFMSPQGFQLIIQCMQYAPRRRASAAQLLANSLFA